MTGPLTDGEWQSLIFITPDRVRQLVMKLAVFHGAVEKSTPESCPVCGKQADKAGQGGLFENQK